MKKIIITSDKYSFCLDGFQKLISKYWILPNKDFTVIGFNYPKIQLENNFNFIKLGENFSDATPWSQALIPYFEHLDDDFFFLCFEDHFLIDKIKPEYFNRAEKIMLEDKSISKIRVHPKYLNHTLEMYDDFFSYGITSSRSYYPTSLRPAIWRKDFFLKLLKNNSEIINPHDFEVKNNLLSFDDKVLVPNELFFSDLDAMRNGSPNKQTLRSGIIDMDYYDITLKEDDINVFNENKKKWETITTIKKFLKN